MEFLRITCVGRASESAARAASKVLIAVVLPTNALGVVVFGVGRCGVRGPVPWEGPREAAMPLGAVHFFDWYPSAGTLLSYILGCMPPGAFPRHLFVYRNVCSGIVIVRCARFP